MNFLHRTHFLRPMFWLPLVLSILILPGCAKVDSVYVPSQKSVSKDWHTQLKGGLTTEEINPQLLAAMLAGKGVAGSQAGVTVATTTLHIPSEGSKREA